MAKKDFSNESVMDTFFTDDENEPKQTVIEKQSNSTNGIKVESSKDLLDKPIAKTFNLEKKDIGILDNVWDRFLGLRKRVNQSEVLRIAISVLDKLDDKTLLIELEKLDRRPLGRKPKI